MTEPPCEARRAHHPLVSIIVPVFRDWALLPGLVARLRTQTVPDQDIEIVIVDNDPPGERPAGVPSLDLPPNARLVPCPTPGAYAARNAGAAVARGRLLVFTDADCRPLPCWLAAMAAAAAGRPGWLLAGPVRLVPSGDPPNAYEIFDRIRGIPQERYVRRGYATTANLAVPRAVFAAIGGFDAGRFSGGDADFCRRAGRAGHALVLVPEAMVEHPCRANWEAVATKARRIKGGQLCGGSRRMRAQWLLRTLTPPLRATTRFLGAPRPWRERLVALGVLYRLWGIELVESARLLAGGTPERR